MTWQTSTVDPAVTSPADDITKILNDLQQLRAVLGGGSDIDIPVGLKQRDTINAVLDYACDNTGLTNTTTQLLAFYQACISSGKRGYIPAGTYLVTAGVLVFDTPFVDAVWPDIDTAGHQAVTFKRADATNAPMLKWTNGTATSGVGRYWRGGSHGGITIDQSGKTKASAQHGLSLRGMWRTKFGHIRVNDAGGSAIYVEPLLYLGNNPDPYAVTFPRFEGVEANRCKRYAIENANFVGLNLGYVDTLRAVECELGVWYGLGASNKLGGISAASCKGVVFDDGAQTSVAGGAPSRFTLGGGEIDDCEYTFRLNRQTGFESGLVRVVHRKNFGPLNPSGGSWPRKVLDLNGGTSPNTSVVKIPMIHRIEPSSGFVKADLGSFVDGHSDGNLTNIEVDQTVFDNAGVGVSDTDLFMNMLATTGSVKLTRGGQPIFDSSLKHYARVGAAAGLTIANTGYTTTKVALTSEISDRLGLWNGTDTFTCTKPGEYRVTAVLCLALAAGKRVRMAIMKNASTVAADRVQFAVGASAQHYELVDYVTLAAGDTLWLSADQDNAASVAVSTPVSVSVDNHLIVEAV